jgi:hypothetical protein
MKEKDTEGYHTKICRKELLGDNSGTCNMHEIMPQLVWRISVGELVEG